MITKADYKTLKHDHQLVKGPVYDALVELGIHVDELRVMTDLTTKRAEVPYENGLLVLDKSFYGEHNIPTRPAENKIKRATAVAKK